MHRHHTFPKGPQKTWWLGLKRQAEGTQAWPGGKLAPWSRVGTFAPTQAHTWLAERLAQTVLCLLSSQEHTWASQQVLALPSQGQTPYAVPNATTKAPSAPRKRLLVPRIKRKHGTRRPRGRKAQTGGVVPFSPAHCLFRDYAYTGQVPGRKTPTAHTGKPPGGAVHTAFPALDSCSPRKKGRPHSCPPSVSSLAPRSTAPVSGSHESTNNSQLFLEPRKLRSVAGYRPGSSRAWRPLNGRRAGGTGGRRAGRVGTSQGGRPNKPAAPRSPLPCAGRTREGRALDRAGALRLRAGTERLGPSKTAAGSCGRPRAGGRGRGADQGPREGRRGRPGRPGSARRRAGGVRPRDRAGGSPARARGKGRAGVGPRPGQPSARPRLPGSAGPEHHRRRRLTQRPRPAVPGPTRRRRRWPRPDSPSAAPLAAPARAAPAARPAAPPAVPEEAAPPAARPAAPPAAREEAAPPAGGAGARPRGGRSRRGQAWLLRAWTSVRRPRLPTPWCPGGEIPSPKPQAALWRVSSLRKLLLKRPLLQFEWSAC